MARQLMPKSGVIMPYVVVSRDTTIAGVSTVDGVPGDVTLSGTYLNINTARSTYLSQTNADLFYIKKADADTRYMALTNPTVPLTSALYALVKEGANQYSANIAKATTSQSGTGTAITYNTTQILGDTKTDLLFNAKSNPRVLVGSNTTPATFYTTANKPSLADLGAAARGINSDITELGSITSKIQFTGGGLIGQNASVGQIYLRGKAPASGAGTEVNLDGTTLVTTINGPGGIHLNHTTDITATAGIANNQALRVKGRVVATADNNAISIVNTADTNACYYGAYKADGSTNDWQLGKTGTTGRTTFVKTGVGSLYFEDLDVMNKTSGTRRVVLEASGHRIEFGGSSGTAVSPATNPATYVADPSNYYNVPAGGTHNFNGTVAAAGNFRAQGGQLQIANDGDRYINFFKANAATVATAIINQGTTNKTYLRTYPVSGTGAYKDITFDPLGGVINLGFAGPWGFDNQYNADARRAKPAASGQPAVAKSGGSTPCYAPLFEELTGGNSDYHPLIKQRCHNRTAGTAAWDGSWSQGTLMPAGDWNIVYTPAGAPEDVTPRNWSFKRDGSASFPGSVITGSYFKGQFQCSNGFSFVDKADQAMTLTNGHIIVNGGNASTAENGRGSIATAGRIFASAALVVRSDRNLKNNFKAIDNAAEKLKEITGYTYGWKDPEVDKDYRSVGVVAQDVQKVLPEAIYTHEDKTLSLDYNGVIAILVNAVKELTARVEELENANK